MPPGAELPAQGLPAASQGRCSTHASASAGCCCMSAVAAFASSSFRLFFTISNTSILSPDCRGRGPWGRLRAVQVERWRELQQQRHQPYAAAAGSHSSGHSNIRQQQVVSAAAAAAAAPVVCPPAAHLPVPETLHRHAALGARRHLAHVVLHAAQRGQGALQQRRRKAQHGGVWVAVVE